MLQGFVVSLLEIDNNTDYGDDFYMTLIINFCKICSILHNQWFKFAGPLSAPKPPAMACILWGSINQNKEHKLTHNETAAFRPEASSSFGFTLTTSLPTYREDEHRLKEQYQELRRDDMVKALPMITVIEPPPQNPPLFGHCAEHPGFTRCLISHAGICLIC